MKKITVRVIGGLGNQLHCYAFGRALAVQNRAVLELDAESGFWNDPYNREYLLDRFPNLCVSYRVFRSKTKSARLLFKFHLRFLTAYSRLLPVSLKSVIAEELPPGYKARYHAEIHRTRYFGNSYFMGYWASYRYYKDIEKQLRQELQPSIPTHPTVVESASQIQSVRSCFIHWRSYNEEKGAKRHNLREYYRDAINLVSSKYPDVVFFVFSDDPAGVREEINSHGRKLIYADSPSAQPNSQCFADFYLMYICDHAIIGNSTFSWWAAWLSEQEGKMVVAPRGLSPWGEDWLPPHWVALDMNGS